MRNERVKEISLTAVFTAIVLVLGLVPFLGYIPITPMVGFTIIHIPVLIGAAVGGKRVGGFLGLVFGLTSLFVAWTRPAGLLDPIFTNPLVSVLPRFLFGFYAYDLLQLLQTKIKNNTLSDILYFVIMTALHSIVVVSLMYISGVNYLYFDVYGLASGLTRQGTLDVLGGLSNYLIGGSSVFGFLLTILVFNSLLEIALCAIIGVPVSRTLKTALNTK